MIVDWNWFFAAFAQSAAALIAIIGAFIISKLLGENEKEEKQSNEIDELIQLERICNAFAIKLTTYSSL